MKDNKTKEHIVSLIQKYAEQTGETPKYNINVAELGISPTVVRKTFGTWNAAIKSAGLTPRIRSKRIDVNCKECDNPFSIIPSAIRSVHLFCSNSCSTTFNNKGKSHSNITKEKISKSLKGISRPPRPPKIYERECQYCSNLFLAEYKNKKYCSSNCRNITASIRTSEWLSKNRDHIRGPHKQSYMEESFENWLQQHDISKGISGYLTEIYFFNNQTKRNGWADFVFPRKRIIIELDGSHHIKRKDIDNIRDEYLKSRGWEVIRITHKQYQKQSRMDEIKSLLKV